MNRQILYAWCMGTLPEFREKRLGDFWGGSLPLKLMYLVWRPISGHEAAAALNNYAFKN